MRRTVAVALLLASLTLPSACTKKAQRLEEAYSAWQAALAGTDDAEAKVAATRDFLDRFPDSAHTRDAAETLVEILDYDLKRPAEASAYLAALAGRVGSPDTRAAVVGARIQALGALKDSAGLQAAATELATGREMRYPERSALATAAVEAGDWNLALSTAEAALPLATPEAIKADYPKRNLSEQRLADTARRRRVEMLGTKGWALANLGRSDEAVAALHEAYQEDFRGYMGNTESPVGGYLGRALAMAGKSSEAENLLAVAALYGGDADATTSIRKRFAEGTQGDAAFAKYLEGERDKLARPVSDFTLPDYAGAPQRFSALRNGEVTLLSFWFPT